MFVAAWFGGLFSLFVLCLVMRPPVAPAEEQMVTGALIEGLQRIEAKDQSILMSPLGDQLPAAESTLPTFESHYTRLAREKTIHELGRLQDPRAVPVLVTLLEHPDPGVRLASVRALQSMREVKSLSAFERLAEKDSDHDVRAAAKAALASPPGF